MQTKKTPSSKSRIKTHHEHRSLSSTQVAGGRRSSAVPQKTVAGLKKKWQKGCGNKETRLKIKQNTGTNWKAASLNDQIRFASAVLMECSQQPHVWAQKLSDLRQNINSTVLRDFLKVIEGGIKCLNAERSKQKKPCKKGLKVDISSIQRDKIADYHDQFMSNASQFSLSWRQQLQKQKRPHLS